MTTVLQPGEAPRDNTGLTLLQSDSTELYGRNNGGGNRTGMAGDAPAGVIPSNPIKASIADAYSDDSYRPAMGPQPVTTANTQAGPAMGHGATIVQVDSGNMESGIPDSQTVGGGTVGNSGNQGNF